MRRSRAPDIGTATFRLPLPTLPLCLFFRAVRSLLLIRSLTDATELYTGIQIWCKKTRADNLVRLDRCPKFLLEQFQESILCTCFLAGQLGLFQQFVDDTGSVDRKKQDLKVAQSA